MTRIAALALFLLVSVAPAFSQDTKSADEIVKALTPKPMTRGFQRGVTVEGGMENAGPPSVDLYVTFPYDSAELDTDAVFTLENLGKALTTPALSSYHFRIAGHTDAKGTDEYNLALSERRARSVRGFLIEKYGVDASRLEAVGYGESQLLDPTRPEDGVNRRVQVINTTEADK
jgi:outer membrane protein OmpA-like peptidoglycan-associated protein